MTKALEKIIGVAVDAIGGSPFQYRQAMSAEELEGLVASVREHGILQPVLVREITGKNYKGVRFQLVAGHRRWEAAKGAGLATIPAIVKVLTDIQAAELALIENVQREDPDDWSTALGIRKVMELHAEAGEPLSEIKLARKLDKSTGYIRNHLGLFKLDMRLQDVARRKSAVRSSLFEIQKVIKTDAADDLIMAVDAGAAFKAIKARVESIQAEEKRKKESSKAPDTETGSRALANAQSGGGQMSRGRQVTGTTRKDAKEGVDRGLGLLEAWVPHCSDADFARVVAFARRVVRGDLAR